MYLSPSAFNQLLEPPTLARNDKVQLPRRNDCVDCRAFRRLRGGAIQYGERRSGPNRPTGFAARRPANSPAPRQSKLSSLGQLALSWPLLRLPFDWRLTEEQISLKRCDGQTYNSGWLRAPKALTEIRPKRIELLCNVDYSLRRRLMLGRALGVLHRRARCVLCVFS